MDLTNELASVTVGKSGAISREKGAKSIWKYTEWLIARQEFLAGAFLLMLITVAVFQVTLSYPPAEADDVRLLSSVANTKDPLKYMVGDWGMDMYMQGGGYEARAVYRPLHTISLWVVYKVFGVRSLPNQFINLILHFLSVILVYAILRKIQEDTSLAFLMAGLCLLSIYTVSPASWVSDRSTLIVANCLLLLIYHLLKSDETDGKVSLAWIAGLSLIALLSKESGIMIPVFAAAAVLISPSLKRDRYKVITLCSIIFVVYMVLRLVLFGQRALNYSESGYIFGVTPYDDWSMLPRHLQIIALIENAVKNVLASFLPIFNQPGGLEVRWVFGVEGMLIWVPTLLLFIMACTRKLSLLQKYSIVIILLNSLIHYQVFRYRVHYISEIAFCLFVGASPVWKELMSRKVVAKALAAILMISSLIAVHTYLDRQLHFRETELNKNELTTILERYPEKVDREVVRKIVERYKKTG